MRAAIRFVACPFLAAMSDRVGRWSVLVMALFVAFIVLVMALTLPYLWAVLLAAGISGLAVNYETPTMTMIVELVRERLDKAQPGRADSFRVDRVSPQEGGGGAAAAAGAASIGAEPGAGAEAEAAGEGGVGSGGEGDGKGGGKKDAAVAGFVGVPQPTTAQVRRDSGDEADANAEANAITVQIGKNQGVLVGGLALGLAVALVGGSVIKGIPSAAVAGNSTLATSLGNMTLSGNTGNVTETRLCGNNLKELVSGERLVGKIPLSLFAPLVFTGACLLVGLVMLLTWVGETLSPSGKKEMGAVAVLKESAMALPKLFRNRFSTLLSIGFMVYTLCISGFQKNIAFYLAYKFGYKA